MLASWLAFLVLSCLVAKQLVTKQMHGLQVLCCGPARQGLPVLHDPLCCPDGCRSAHHCAVDAHVIAQVRG